MARKRLWRLAIAVCCAATSTLSGCRDNVTPFQSADPGEGAFGRLTFSRGEDRSPIWSATGDTIFYSAQGFGHLPDAPGVLVGIPRTGGSTEQILKNVQLPGRGRWHVAPALVPGGDRIAFIEIAPLLDVALFCNPALTDLSCNPTRATAPLPPLQQVTVRVRRFDATGPLADDPALEVDIRGAEQIEGPNPFQSPVFHVVHDFPFQQLFGAERSFLFRASWSPEGDRLVLSDGLRLLIWDTVSNDVSAVPGSEEGIGPAWSPDGAWIAFTRLERADSTNTQCLFQAPLGTACVQERTDYTSGAQTLTLIRPDGSEVRDLGTGDEPAWSPDGSVLFFRRDDQIWRLPVAGGEPVAVNGTEGGREPAVAPNGSALAFAKRSPSGDHDIWIVSAEP